MIRFIIASIWLILASCAIYNVFYYSSIGFMIYVFMCLIATMPLAGFVFDFLDKIIAREKNPFIKVAIMGGVIAISVSITDAIAFSQNFMDFFCDLIEIGFGFFAVISFAFGKILYSFFGLEDMADILERRKKEKKDKRYKRKLDIVAKAMQNGRDCLTKKEFDIYLEYSCKHGDPIEKRKREQAFQNILAIVKTEGENGLDAKQLAVYKKYKEKQEQKAKEEKQAEERRRREQEYLPQIKTSIVEEINQILSNIIDDGLEKSEYCIYGGKGYEERYYARDYPLQEINLKSKTCDYARLLAGMDSRELKRHFKDLDSLQMEREEQELHTKRDQENLKRQKIYKVDNRGRELLIYNQAGSLIGGIRLLSNEVLRGYTTENITTQSGDYIITYNNLGQKISTIRKT